MRRHEHNEGFSLLEMLVSMTILLVVVAVAFSALLSSQKIYGSQQLQADMHAGLRSSFELVTQEIGQARAINFAPQTLTAAVTANASAQTVTVSSSANVFVGERLTVDTTSSGETVLVTAVPSSNQIRGIFTKNHANGAAVVAQGVFPQGVLSGSTATALKLFGDINGDGSLSYVRYDCDTSAGTLTRSITTVAPGVTTQNPPQILLSDLIANPDGTPCFQYSTTSVTVGATTYTFIPSLAVSLTVQTAKIDPQTGTFVTMTKSFSNLASRNVLAGLAMAQSSPPVTVRLQPTPPGLPLTP